MKEQIQFQPPWKKVSFLHPSLESNIGGVQSCWSGFSSSTKSEMRGRVFILFWLSYQEKIDFEGSQEFWLLNGKREVRRAVKRWEIHHNIFLPYMKTIVLDQLGSANLSKIRINSIVRPLCERRPRSSKYLHFKDAFLENILNKNSDPYFKQKGRWRRFYKHYSLWV